MAIIGLVVQIVYIGALFFVGYYIIKKAVKKGIIEAYNELGKMCDDEKT